MECTIKKVELETGLSRDWLLVTAEVYGLLVVVKVPATRAKSYTIGRKINVHWELAK
jgi:hypothetical protein